MRHTPRITKRSIKGFKACKGASDARLLTREPERLFAFRHRRMGQMQGHGSTKLTVLSLSKESSEEHWSRIC